jgi:phenylpropionate dioxygenase-like ring-hydroxylating dioxygenase large terminal subunit
MRYELQIDILNRALDLIDKRETEMVDNIFAVPVEDYTSTTRFEREREILFRRFPIVVGFSSQVARPGDFFTNNHLGVPLLITRDMDGQLNAFINACRHRGSQLVSEPCGNNQKVFVCPYHGWCYEANGKLRGVTHPVGFPELKKEEHGLVRVPVAERYGMVFAMATPGESFDLDEFLGPLLQDLDTLGLGDFVLVEAMTHRRKMNWKLQVDAALETYHFHYLHEGTLDGYYSNIAVLDWEEPHARIVVPKRSMTKLIGTDPSTWSLPEHSAILYGIFPNTGVFIGGGNAHVLCTYPVDADNAILYGGMLVPPGEVDEKIVELRKFFHQHYWRSQTEDMVIAEAVQANLRSGVNTDLLFGRQEHLIGKFHAAMDAALDGRLTPNKSLVS